MIALLLSNGMLTKPSSTKSAAGFIYADPDMTMTKKRLLLLASLPLTIVVILGVLAMLPPSPGVTKANFDCLQEGMTLAEVQKIFGEEGEWFGEITLWEIKAPWTGFVWLADDGSIAGIRFVDDCVTDKRWTISNETILDKIRRWLHLR